MAPKINFNPPAGAPQAEVDVRLHDVADRMKAPDQRAVEISYGSASNIPWLSRQLDELGLNPEKLLADALAALESARTARDRISEFEERIRGEYGSARDEYAAGKLSTEDFADVAARFHSLTGDSPALKSLGSRPAALERSAAHHAAVAVAGPVWDSLDSAARSCAEGSVKPAAALRKKVGDLAGLSTQDQLARAMARGADAAGLFAELMQLVGRWDELHKFARDLANRSLAPQWTTGRVVVLAPGAQAEVDSRPVGINIERAQGIWLRYGAADRLPVDYLTGRFAPVYRLATAVEVGAEPGVYRADEARERSQAWIRRVQNLPPIDDRGNLIKGPHGENAVDAAFAAFPGVLDGRQAYNGAAGTQSVIGAPGAGFSSGPRP